MTTIKIRGVSKLDFSVVEKSNKNTLFTIYAMVTPPSYPNEGSNWGTSPGYRVAQVTTRKGKVVRIDTDYPKYTGSTMFRAPIVDTPEWLMKDARVASFLANAMEELKESIEE